MNHAVQRLRNTDWAAPRPAWGTFAVWGRNFLVWRKLMGPSLLFNFGEPLLYLLGLGYGLGRFIGEVEGMNYIAFLSSGLLASSSMNTATFEALYSVYTRMVPQQTYDGMLCTPVDVDDIVLGEMLWCATKGVISSAAILIVAVGLGALHGWQLWLCLPAFFLTGLCFTGVALVVSAVSPSYDFFSYYVTLAITPMYIFCGVFYPTNALPELAQAFVNLLPLTHAVALIRPLATGTIPADALQNIPVLAAWALGGFYLAVVLVRRRLIK
jgi:lipooligosaccharide transport system permease protein